MTLWNGLYGIQGIFRLYCHYLDLEIRRHERNIRENMGDSITVPGPEE